MRLTHALVQVATAIGNSPDERLWGYQVSQKTKLASGVLYPVLHRMLERGWVEDGWEELSPAMEKRPRRRYYVVTDLGHRELGLVLDRARRDPRFSDFEADAVPASADRAVV